MINTNICSDYEYKHIQNPLKPTRREKKVVLSRGIEVHGRYEGKFAKKDLNVQKKKKSSEIHSIVSLVCIK